MSKKIAVVTGANKGLGFAIVKQLCEQYKGTVYLTSRDPSRGLEACKELEKIGLKPAHHQLDVTDIECVKRFCDYVQENDKSIEILINNAGVLFGKESPEPKIYQTEQTLFVNFFSLVDFTEAVLPFIPEGGVIVNISSSSGHLSRIPSDDLKSRISKEDITLENLKALMKEYIEAVRLGKGVEDGWGSSPYVVSKVGLNAYTFLLHRRLAGKDITVNCVHPGYVQSDMTGGAGSVSPADAAAVPVTLALRPSTKGAYVWSNGAVVPWDGQDPRVYIDGKTL